MGFNVDGMYHVVPTRCQVPSQKYVKFDISRVPRGTLRAMTRYLAQFSCGAASAVATKIVLTRFGLTDDVVIANAFLKREDPDNRRFLADCETWFGQKVLVLRDEKYGADPIEVFRRRRYIKGRYGAPCTSLLKRELLRSLEQPGDVLVLGYTSEEDWRLDDFREQWPDRPVIAPLIDAKLSKTDCKAMVQRAGIELPLMYRLGYDNANCKACPKGGAGYFRAIRQDFPEDFNALADVEAGIGPGAYVLYHRSGPLKGQRFPLRELSLDGPVRRNEKLPSCSFFCETAEVEYTETDPDRIEADAAMVWAKTFAKAQDENR